MSSIAIFSDVHANLPALAAVLSDIHNRKALQVFCLGDLVDFAPWNNEVIESIRHNHITCIMGNHDERIAFDKPVVQLAKHSEAETAARIAAVDYTRHAISIQNKKYLKELPAKVVLDYKFHDRDFHIHLVHGSTRSNSEYIYENHDEKDLRGMLDTNDADIIVLAHTHMAYVRRIHSQVDGSEKYVLNCGSVGRSKEEDRLATYLLLTIENDSVYPEIIKLAYPVEETINGILQSNIPDFYADFFKL